MLTDEEIEKCREKAAASYKRHYHSTRGQMASSSDDPEMHLIWAVIAAYEAKLREQNEPVALYDGNKFYANEKSAICGCADMANLNQVFLHPAPIPEGIQDFIYKFKRHVGGDGEFWLHELEDFYDKMAARSGE